MAKQLKHLAAIPFGIVLILQTCAVQAQESVSAPVLIHDLMTSHREEARAEEKLAAISLQIAAHRETQLEKLSQQGHASWQELQLAKADVRDATAATAAAKLFRVWIDRQVQSRLIHDTESVDAVSLLIQLPESSVPIAWFTMTTTAAGDSSWTPRDRSHQTSVLLKQTFAISSGTEADQRAARFRQESLEKTLADLTHAPASEQTELKLRCHQAAATVDLRAAVQRLLELELGAVRWVASHSHAGASEQHQQVSEADEAFTQLQMELLKTLHAESYSQTKQLATRAVRDWSAMTSSSLTDLQKAGFASSRDSWQQNQQTQSMQALLDADGDLRNWKLNWINRRAGHDDFTATVVPSFVVSEMAFTPPDLSRDVLRNVTLLRVTLTWIKEAIALQQRDAAMAGRIESTEELLQRLEGQSRINSVELEMTERFLSLLCLQRQSDEQRQAILRRLVGLTPQLAGVVHKSGLHSFALHDRIDDETASILIRSEEIHLARANVQSMQGQMMRFSKRISAMEDLQKDGLASVHEVDMARQQLLSLQATEAKLVTSKLRHQARQQLLETLLIH